MVARGSQRRRGRRRTTVAPTATISYRARYTDASVNIAYLFVAADIGAATATRVVVVIAHTNNGNISSVTIGGVTASVAVAVNNADENSGIYYLAVASGTTATIIVNCASALCCGIEVFALDGLVSGTPADTGSASDLVAGTGSLSADVDTVIGSVGVVGAHFNGTAVTATFTGATEQVDATFGSNEFSAAADFTAVAVETPRAVSVVPSSSAKRVIVSAVWA